MKFYAKKFLMKLSFEYFIILNILPLGKQLHFHFVGNGTIFLFRESS